MTTETKKSKVVVKTKIVDIKRDKRGKFVKGIIPPISPGRPKVTEEQKVTKLAVKQLLKQYEEGLADALPEISPVLIKSAKEGQMQAIQEIHKVLGAYKKEGGNTIIPIQINFRDDDL